MRERLSAGAARVPVPSRRAALAAGLAAAVATTLAVATPAPASPAASTAVAHSAFDVYFRHDAVGRGQLALVATTCGTERWTVKTAADDDRHRIDTDPVRATIRHLRHRPTPASKPQTGRVAPVETTTYRVHTRLVSFVREDDGDYHLVLRDRHGRTMIGEIPNPSCVAAISPVRDAIARARHWFDRRYVATTAFKPAGRRVVVTGVGFFDYFHGQTGMAPNDLELHPVTGIRYR